MNFPIFSVLLALLVVFQFWNTGRKNAQIHRLEQAAAQQVIQAEEARTKAVTEVRSTEVGLVRAAASDKEKTNEEIRTLARQRDDLVRRLRVAEANAATARLIVASAATTDGEAACGDPGAELPGRIGEEDVAEAFRADTIRLHLKACYAQYDRAEAALRDLNKKNQNND